MHTGAAWVVVMSLGLSSCCCSLPAPKGRVVKEAPHPLRSSSDGGSIPTEAERIAALREIFPSLPLKTPQPLPLPDGTLGAPVVPWIQYYVSPGNCDASGAISRVLGMPEDDVFTQLDDVIDRIEGHGGDMILTSDVLEGVPGAHRVFTFAQFERAHESNTEVWWTIDLPVLNDSRDVAFINAQLGASTNAEDFWWLAKKKDGAWSVTSIKVTF